MRRRDFVKLSALLLPALATSRTAIAQAQSFPDPSDEAKLYEGAKKEGTLTWYQAGPLEPFGAIAKRFEKKYPGIKTQILQISGTKQYQRFLQEETAGQHIADHLLMSDRPSMQQLIEKGLIAEWRVPTIDRIPEHARHGHFAYAPATTVINIAYNTQRVTPEEAKILGSSWKGVLDPRFKGRFTVTNSKTGVSYGALALFLDPAFANEFGEDFLKKVMAQKPVVYSDNTVALERVVAGEHDFAYWSWDAQSLFKLKQGAPIRWVHPSPTPMYSNFALAVPKNAPHPYTARLFQNWWFSEDGASAMQEEFGSRSAMIGMPDTSPVAKEPWNPPITNAYEISFTSWAENYEKHMGIWHKIQQAAR
jgi:iron(III) transport system substrate-binding protein